MIESEMMDMRADEEMHRPPVQGAAFSRQSFARTIVERVGAATQFHSCSAAGMDVHAVIDFREYR